jgi:hypothetical protein
MVGYLHIRFRTYGQCGRSSYIRTEEKDTMSIRRFSNLKFLAVAFLAAFSLVIGTTGCGSGDADKNVVSPIITPPTVIVVTPAPGDVGVCPNTTIITARFSKAMNPATINPSTFTLTGPGGPVLGAVTYTAATNSVTFTPASPLALSTLYTATITTGVADTFGNHLAENFVWSFTTPPSCVVTVIAVTPPNGDVGVCPNTTIITATFNRAMNPATINTSTFTLTGPGAVNVPGAIAWIAATNTATFTPSSPLAVNTLYTATITTGVADTFGDHLAANFVWSFTTPPSCVVTVIAVTPTNGNVGVCPNPTIITATFNKAMNPATINPTTFTLTGPGAVNVPGAVTYVAATKTATFTPLNPLAVSTLYTATITTGVADTFGDHLAADFVWSFTTPPLCVEPPPAIPLGAACSFGILGATPVVSNVVSAGTNVTGDVGIWPAASITGFPPGTLTGTKHAGDAVAMAAQGALTTAFNDALIPPGAAIPADIGGMTLLPGVYKATTTLGITGTLTLDGNGDPNAFWIFQVGSALTTAAGPPPPAAPASQVKLINGAEPDNVFWVVGSSATLGTYSIFQGTIMAQASITLTTGARLEGRALARTGAVTMDSNKVNVPPCP